MIKSLTPILIGLLLSLSTATRGVAAPPAVPPVPPWTNRLGMKFVPVPGTDVLFSIWDTRVQDYHVFATATERAWPKTKFTQGPTHPAVNVSWDDAKAFCAWLTEKERNTGALTPTQEYRLPTDLEWSAAVGLGKETGDSPTARGQSTMAVFPWGTLWPLPRKVGNFNRKSRVDNYEFTSPVGSFAPNRFGLYDMGGNVCQWCEDYYDGRSGARVLRGSSWSMSGRTNLLSSWRSIIVGYMNLNSRRDVGFRCVLTHGEVPAPQAKTEPADPPADPPAKADSNTAATPVAPPATPDSSTTANPPPTPPPSMSTSSHMQADANQTPTQILSQQALNATAWVLAPLNQPVPGDIRQNLTDLREDLLDEGKAAPKANADLYKLGSQLCNNLLAALDERDQTLVRAGFRAAQAAASTKVTSQALEARRNYMMSWPQYAREQDQRGEIQRQQTAGANLVKESVKVDWANRSAVLRKALDAQYARYRDALRQDGK